MAISATEFKGYPQYSGLVGEACPLCPWKQNLFSALLNNCAVVAYIFFATCDNITNFTVSGGPRTAVETIWHQKWIAMFQKEHTFIKLSFN